MTPRLGLPSQRPRSGAKQPAEAVPWPRQATFALYLVGAWLGRSPRPSSDRVPTHCQQVSRAADEPCRASLTPASGGVGSSALVGPLRGFDSLTQPGPAHGAGIAARGRDPSRKTICRSGSGPAHLSLVLRRDAGSAGAERDRANDRAACSQRCGVQRGTRVRGCDASYSSTVT